MPASINDLSDSLMKEATLRTATRQEKISHNLSLIKKGRGHEAESQERLDKYEERQASLVEDGEWLAKTPLVEDVSKPLPEKSEPTSIDEDLGLERLIGSTNDLLSIEFLEAGLLAARSVGRITGFTLGTGFHVGNGIILTNNHVFSDPTLADTFTFELNVEENKFPPPKAEFVFNFTPERFFFTDKELDFTLVAVEGDVPLEKFGWHVLQKEEGKIRIGDPVNIIQHPSGGNKQITVHNSHFVDIENDSEVDPFCWYTGDTLKGSSGAPVFNSRWEVVALHHKAVPKTNKNSVIVDKDGRAMSEERIKENPDDVAWLANEGIRISRLVQRLENTTFDNAEHTSIRDELLTLWSRRGAHARGLKAS